MFKPGEIVEWTLTQKHGSGVRRGRVVTSIPPNKTPIAIARSVGTELISSYCRFKPNQTSTTPRVLVRVERQDDDGNPLEPWYYAPRMAAIAYADLEDVS